MFIVDSNITDLKIKERNLFKVLFSMNIHQVATPELSVEDAKSYIFFCREGSGKVMAYIGLYFTHTDRKLYYTYSSNPFPEGEISDVEAEARAFAEDMGAMLDEIDIAKMSSEEKNRWINDQDIFSAKKKTEEKPAEPLTPAAGVAQVPVQPAPAVLVQPATAEPAAPPVQPAPAVQPPAVEPAAPPVQQAPAAVQPAAPAVQPQMQTPQPPTPVQAPAAPPIQAAPHPKKRQAAPPAAPVPASDRTPASGVATGDVLDEALKAGVVKAPKKQLSNDLRSATGKVSRDKEALARLLASF